MNWEREAKLWKEVDLGRAAVLEMMNYVFHGKPPLPGDERWVFCRKWHDEDPKAFGAQMVGLEMQYQKSLQDALRRDATIAEQEKEIAGLKAELAAAQAAGPSLAKDQNTEKILDYIDRLRQETLEQMDLEQREGRNAAT